jgi:AcrR family transcriptional regulator
MAQRNRPATEDRIRSAAWRLLEREGLPSWGVNAVAREAGVDKVLLYRYFGGHEELLLHLLERHRFWPDPAALTTSGPRAFLRESLPLLAASRPLHCLLSLPADLPVAQEAARCFADQEAEWREGFLAQCEGRLAREEEEAWTAWIARGILVEPSALSVSALWNRVSPPLRERENPLPGPGAEQELPTELL